MFIRVASELAEELSSVQTRTSLVSNKVDIIFVYCMYKKHALALCPLSHYYTASEISTIVHHLAFVSIILSRSRVWHSVRAISYAPDSDSLIYRIRCIILGTSFLPLYWCLVLQSSEIRPPRIEDLPQLSKLPNSRRIIHM